MGRVLTLMLADAEGLTSSKMQQEDTAEKFPFHSMKPTKGCLVLDPVLDTEHLTAMAPFSCPRGTHILF